MPRTIRFHLDENCDPAIAVALRLRSIDATTTAQEGLLSAPDEDHVAHALAQTRVTFTQDKDFLRLHALGIPHAGIAYCRPQSRALGDIIDGLVLIWEILEPEEVRGRIEFL